MSSQNPGAKQRRPVRHSRLTLLSHCPACGEPLPLNGPIQRTVCTECTGEVEIPLELWRTALQNADNYARPQESNSSAEMTSDLLGGSRVTFRAALPRCLACHATLPPPRQAADFETAWVCPSCRENVPAFAAPPWLRQLVPNALGVVAAERDHESPADASDVETDRDALAPIAFTCPNCSGALHVTPTSERVLPCEFCGTKTFLPDPLWRMLHPKKVVTEWFVSFAGLRPWTKHMVQIYLYGLIFALLMLVVVYLGIRCEA